MLKLIRSSTEVVSVENYEIRLFKFDYVHMLMYLCRVSFLTILDIYKDYFKGRRTYIVWPEEEIALVHYSLWRSYYIFTQRVLWPRSFLIFIVDELKSFATKNLCSQQSFSSWWISHVLGSMHHWLVTYWDSCIKWRYCRYNTSLIGYWGKGSTVGWYIGIRQTV